MYGMSAFAGLAVLCAMSNLNDPLTPEEIEDRRVRRETYAAEQAAKEAARHPATKRRERSPSLERMLGKRKNSYR